MNPFRCPLSQPLRRSTGLSRFRILDFLDFASSRHLASLCRRIGFSSTALLYPCDEVAASSSSLRSYRGPFEWRRARIQIRLFLPPTFTRKVNLNIFEIERTCWTRPIELQLRQYSAPSSLEPIPADSSSPFFRSFPLGSLRYLSLRLLTHHSSYLQRVFALPRRLSLVHFLPLPLPNLLPILPISSCQSPVESRPSSSSISSPSSATRPPEITNNTSSVIGI